MTDLDTSSLSALTDQRKSFVERRDDAIHLLGKLRDSELTVTTRDKLKDSNYLTATFFTQIGVLTVLIFLVQILISLYKYNTRIIAFYASRLDCIRLWDEKVDSLSSYIELITPAVDFSRDPRHPIEIFLDAWRGRRTGSATEAEPTQVRATTQSQRRRDRSEETLEGTGPTSSITALTGTN